VGETAWKFVRKVRRNEIDKPDFEFLAPTDAAGVWLVSTARTPTAPRRCNRFDLATGALGDVVLAHADRDIEGCLLDSRRNLVAAAYGDDRIGYEFADQTLGRISGASTPSSATTATSIWSASRTTTTGCWRWSAARPTAAAITSTTARPTAAGAGHDPPWLASAQLARMEMLDVKARDGQALRAYLTVPLAGGPRPLVVMPHGGPELRDTYRFDIFAQAFAAQGWMVLQPNFRGSGGYGRAFAEAGHRHWGDLMQQDLETPWTRSSALARRRQAVAIWGRATAAMRR